MNRYVIHGLLEDMVQRNKQIIVASSTFRMGEEDIFRPMEHELKAKTGGWGYQVQRITRPPSVCRIEARGGGSIEFLPLLGRSLEGKRADIWAVYGRPSSSLVNLDQAMSAIGREVQRNPNSELILLD